MDESSSKRCPVCRAVKPLTEFGVDRSKADGKYPSCRACCRKREGRRRARDFKVNPEKFRNQWRKYYGRLKDAVLDHYGRACACPGCGATEGLSIDHVNGDGKQHRIELTGRDTASVAVYRWLAENGFPPEYQVLCNRCNASKGTGPACRLDHGALNVPAQPGVSEVGSIIGKRAHGQDLRPDLTGLTTGL